jgi:hypothetical protein
VWWLWLLLLLCLLLLLSLASTLTGDFCDGPPSNKITTISRMRGLYTIELEYCNDIIGELTQLSRKVFDDTQSVID